MGNLVKDNPKLAAARSPVAGSFRHFQPSNRAKSDGQKARNARLRLQKRIETTVGELLSDPTINVSLLETMISNFNESSSIADIIFIRYVHAISDSKTSIKVVKELSESLIKMGYGDKMVAEEKPSDNSPSLAELLAEIQGEISEKMLKQ
jgi:hypothetical protein